MFKAQKLLSSWVVITQFCIKIKSYCFPRAETKMHLNFFKMTDAINF